MRKIFNILAMIVTTGFVTACSVFGDSGVEIAPYQVVQSDDTAEIRHYNSLILVTAPMQSGMEGDNQAFQRLFDYISGENVAERKIEMTAPVIMQSEKIEMTAPVFMGSDTMSFVLPAEYDLENAPKPLDKELKLVEKKDYTVAVLRFSGFLSDTKAQEKAKILESWIKNTDYTQTGSYLAAGYNPPWTLPFFRRNEVLIPVQKK